MNTFFVSGKLILCAFSVGSHKSPLDLIVNLTGHQEPTSMHAATQKSLPDYVVEWIASFDSDPTFFIAMNNFSYSHGY